MPFDLFQIWHCFYWQVEAANMGSRIPALIARAVSQRLEGLALNTIKEEIREVITNEGEVVFGHPPPPQHLLT